MGNPEQPRAVGTNREFVAQDNQFDRAIPKL
jgi:hypothetical protein